MSGIEPPKSNSFHELDNAKFVWDEYKYRHTHVWNLIFQMTIALVAISTLPYIIPKNAEKKVGILIIAVPFIALLFTIICTLRIAKECQILNKIRKRHRDFHTINFGIIYKDSGNSFTKQVLLYFCLLIVLCLVNLAKVALNSRIFS